jgi:hypothetical protein
VALREANVGPAPPDLHTVEPVYSGKDIALGLTVQIAIGERRSIVVQTHVTRDCSDVELNSILDKVTKALDRQSDRYRLPELKKQRALSLKTFTNMMQNQSETQERWEAEWVGNKRRGPFQLNQSQQQLRNQADNQLNNTKKDIETLEAEIAELEKQIKG